MLCLVGQLPRQIQGMVVCFVWLINSHYKCRVWWCALFGWLAPPTNTGYGGLLCLVDQPLPHPPTNTGYDEVLVGWAAPTTAAFTQSLKVWGKWDKLFKALKVCEN